jgi:hypothetical protein
MQNVNYITESQLAAWLIEIIFETNSTHNLV